MELTMASDMHLHVRDLPTLSAVLPLTSGKFHQAVIMPNLTPPVLTAADAVGYHRRLLASLPAGGNAAFLPLMTVYLTNNTSDADIEAIAAHNVAAAAAAAAAAVGPSPAASSSAGSAAPTTAAAAAAKIVACKLYPAGATTNSHLGVSDYERILPVLHAMAKHRLLLLVHGEVTDADVDIFDRERVFITTILPKLLAVKDLKIVLEHITTREAVEFVTSFEDKTRLGATITAHHLECSRNDMLANGLNPHLYCKPILKRESHRRALVAAATSGKHPNIFAGTDSAPHTKTAKECSCGCAGVFTAPNAIESYAQVFDNEGKIQHLEAFLSLNGPRFYGLPPTALKMTLERKPWKVPDSYHVDGTDNDIVPYKAGQQMTFLVTEINLQ